ncbi:hypothetical protein Pmani_016831 [Petrolisthes manimaculis]|uniref:N-terminal acetyltransferase B complex subunit MDM20 homolog n=1 Tax=Petrolisthes manimaculis TaxID=1843537 RepID=A0AAE1PQT6_9EUCA|nr:hypothetical protein Pmani_016831 [Petrolisthes manimaculis]
MAGKAHVDDSVIERRLRPIYEWLDAGNNKKAVQEADKVLKKQASLPCARVLKGLALLRLGKRDECEGLVAAVVKEAPTDEATLQALTICFRELHQPEQICRVYETATKKEPGNEELLSHLFMAYVRVSNYRNQHQTAMRLFKLKPKNPYYFWAVMSHVMQGVKSGDQKGREVSLLLAERMVNNFVKEGKIEAEAEVLTYLHILETQGKYAEALSVVEGELGNKVVHQPGNFLRLKRATYHTHLGQWQAAADVYRDLIKDEHDNWQHYVGYIRAVMEISGRHSPTHSLNPPSSTGVCSGSDNSSIGGFGGSDNSTGGCGGSDKSSVSNGGEDSGCDTCDKEDPVATAAAHLAAVRKAASTQEYPDRGPFLGVIHLASTLHHHGDHTLSDTLCGDLMELLLSYITSYGDKMCCYADITQYLPNLPQERIAPFLEKVEGLVNRREDGVPLDVKAMYRDLCLVQLSRALGQHEHLSPQEHIQLADSLVNRYSQTLELTSNMADTDIRPGDAYLLLAAHSYLRGAGVREGNTTHPNPHVLLRVAAILERGIVVSRANFQLKLLLIKVYNMLGASEISHTVYEKCDLKHIQLDTLGHTLALQALDAANYTAAADIFSATLKFFMANYKDTSDPLISSYKYGSLTRIPEFVEFRERLSNSLHFATVTAEQMLLDITNEISSHSQLVEAVSQLDIDPATDKTCWDDLRDNRDLRVMDTWDPPHRQLQEVEVNANVSSEVSLLKLRNLTLRLVAAACRLTSHSSSNKASIRDHQHRSSSTKKDSNSECVNGETCGATDDATLLADLTTRLHQESQSCAQYRASSSPQLPLQGPDPSRIHLYASCNLVGVIVRHSEVLQQVHKSCTQSQGVSGEVLKAAKGEVEAAVAAGLAEAQQLAVATLVAACSKESAAEGEATQSETNNDNTFDSLSSDLSKLSLATSSPPLPRHGLERLHHLAQTLGVAAALLGCCHSLLRPIKASTSKKNKKRKDPVITPGVMTEFSSYLTTLSSQIHQLKEALSTQHKAVKAALEQHTKEEYTCLDLTSPLTGPEDAKTIGSQMELSYLKSLERLTASIANKLKYISSLRL